MTETSNPVYATHEEQVSLQNLQQAYVTLIAERDDARRQRDAAWRTETAAVQALADLKDKVRTAAIDHADSESHCRAGLNAWLEALGLDPVVPKWSCTGTWAGIELPEATIVADDEDDARAAYEEAIKAGIGLTTRAQGRLYDTDTITWADHHPDDEVDVDDPSDFDLEVDVNEADE